MRRSAAVLLAVLARRSGQVLCLCWLLLGQGLALAQATPGLLTRPGNSSCLAPARPPATGAISLRTALTMVSSTAMATAFVQSPAQPNRWYLLDRDGEIARYERSGTVKVFTRAGVVANFASRITRQISGAVSQEMGLLGMALHPRFADNGQVFVYYSAVGTQGTAVEARLSRVLSRDGGLTLDMASEEVLLRVPRTKLYHWGGTLKFGQDGYLYISFGDGNERTPAQNLGSLLGKMIRIDVNGGTGYAIPPSNPFVSTAGARPEVYALGLRNPWKWSFDKANGDIWVGDVGGTAWEEVNKLVRGGNYGWPIREGAHCFEGSSCGTVGLIDPVFEFPHTPETPSIAVIGGYVYHGSLIPGLQGVYIFAETSGGRIFALRYDAAGRGQGDVIFVQPGPITSFAQDEDGEVFLLARGKVQQLMPAATVPVSNFPAKLSDTGCMQAGNPALPGPALIPYSVNAPLWSDGASKERWFALPDGKTIGRQADGDFDLPIGAVTVKSFRINGKLVETRLLVRHDDGDWAGYSYEWNDAQTEAFLLPGGKQRQVGAQIWTYPSRNQCLSCHTEAAGRTLGLEVAQLNRDHFYPSTQRLANQLRTLDAIGMFSMPLADLPANLPKLVDPANPAHPIDLRARSYLHANCALCHRPDGPGQGPEDFRYSLPGTSIGAVNVFPTQSTFGIPDARLIFPGKPEKSIISHRMNTLDLGRMPPLGTAVVDFEAVTMINQWIRSGLGMGVPDRDNDGFADNVDNCKNTANPTQLDSDGDGIGNMCDADFNNDGAVNGLDLALLQAAFGSKAGDTKYNARVDMNGDGRINGLDLALFQARFGKPPGDL